MINYFTGDVLKKKWNNLRDAYRKSLLKRKTKCMLAAPRNSKPWKYEKRMSFLNDHLVYSRQLQSNFSSDAGLQCHQDDEEDVAYLDTSEQLLESDGGDATGSSTAQLPLPENNIFQKHTGEHRSSAALGSMSATPTVCENYLAFEEKRRVPQTDEHIAAFFKSAEATARTFSYLHQVHIKAEISSLLTKYEMKNLLASKQRDKDPS